MALSSELPDRAKKFRIFRNGDEQFTGRQFVLNKRRVKTWESFLQQVTNDTKYPEAVRSIRTPVGGSRITSLDSLEDCQNYVAVGNTKFRKIRYLDLESITKRHNALSPRSQLPDVRPVEHSRIQVSGKIRKIPTDVLTIFVYSNGNELQSARRVTLTRTMLLKWDSILREVTTKVGGPTSSLYTLDGQKITDPTALQKSTFYVAVDKRYKKCNYGSQRPGFNTSPKQRRPGEDYVWKLEPIMPRNRKLRTGSDQMDNSIASSTASEKSPKSYRSTISDQAHNRPPPKRRPLPRKRAEKEEESVFHAKPVKHKRNDRPDEVNYDKDEGGIFKAKPGSNRATRGAQEVHETKDTLVDLPIDQVEAEEIADEEIEDESDRRPPPTSREEKKVKPKVRRAKSPKKLTRSPTPPPRTPTPAERSPTPAQRSLTPAQRTPTPEQRSPTPNERTPSPKDRTPTPRAASRSPANDKEDRHGNSDQDQNTKSPDMTHSQSTETEHAGPVDPDQSEELEQAKPDQSEDPVETEPLEPDQSQQTDQSEEPEQAEADQSEKPEQAEAGQSEELELTETVDTYKVEEPEQENGKATPAQKDPEPIENDSKSEKNEDDPIDAARPQTPKVKSPEPDTQQQDSANQESDNKPETNKDNDEIDSEHDN